MKLSSRQGFLRLLELLAIFAGGAALVNCVAIYLGLLMVGGIELIVLSIFGVTFALLGFAVLLVVELVRLSRSGQPWFQRARGLNAQELKQLVQWCPPMLLLSSLLLAAICFALSLQFGKVDWDFSEPLSLSVALPICLSSATFCFLVLPVFASGSRKP